MKRMRWSNLLWAVLAVLMVATAGAVAADNLVPDPDFKKAQFEPLSYESSWMWYTIVAPAEGKLVEDGKAVELTGGKIFLHSSRFAVTAGQTYEVALTAQGTGEVSVECLWWGEKGGMTEPHLTTPIVPVPLDDEKQELRAVATAPEGAVEAYIRVVVENGSITVSKPTVTAAK